MQTKQAVSQGSPLVSFHGFVNIYIPATTIQFLAAESSKIVIF